MSNSALKVRHYVAADEDADGLLIRMKDADWDEVLSVNLRAAFQATRAAGRLMIRQRFGRIVNVTSVWKDVRSL